MCDCCDYCFDTTSVYRATIQQRPLRSNDRCPATSTHKLLSLVYWLCTALPKRIREGMIVFFVFLYSLPTWRHLAIRQILHIHGAHDEERPFTYSHLVRTSCIKLIWLLRSPIGQQILFYVFRPWIVQAVTNLPYICYSLLAVVCFCVLCTALLSPFLQPIAPRAAFFTDQLSG
jgi:hypothetical protein